jgi:diguanylate cyclase (GGDEF)-like protein
VESVDRSGSQRERGDPGASGAGKGADEIARAPRGRILLAEDDELTAQFAAELLRRHGHEVIVVGDGEAAIERASRGDLDLALVDVTLPRVNGLETCRIIKTLPDVGYLPVVLVTMRTDTASRVEGLRIGADDYVSKPYDERELVEHVTTALRTKQLHDQVAAARARLEELSTHDELTGLCNFRHLNTRLTDEFRKSERHHDPLACLLVDIDGLRHWNELHGRYYGDGIVRDVATTLRAALRDVDVVGRYGGDEFLVLLPGTHFAGALSCADRVFRDVRRLSWPSPRDDDAPAARVNLSIGVSLFPSRDVRSKEQLLRAAEASLLRSKRDGGDRICVFQHQGYIYSPPSQSAPPNVAPLPLPSHKPSSNSGIVAARRLPSSRPAPAEAVANGERRGGTRGD